MKTQILFFVTEFWQAGTQRFTYELHSAIDKEKYDITILSYHPLGYMPNIEDYYYSKHIALGAKVLFLNDLLATQKKSWFSYNKKLDLLNAFLDAYAAISFMGEYTYAGVQSKLSPKNKQKSIIHIMNSKYQFPAIYDKYEKNDLYLFCSGFNEKEIKSELSAFQKYNHFYFPLSIKFENDSPLWQAPKNNTKKRIAIFTRITNTKPLDPFLYAFHLLQNIDADTELHIYGNHDEYLDTVKQMQYYLNIHKQTFFKGHVTYIKKTALEDDLHLVWFHSFYGSPGGFAGFDMASIGVPQLFWNFTNTEEDDVSNVFPVYNNMNLFVQHSQELLHNREALESLSKLQFNKVKETRDIMRYMPQIEAMYHEVINNSK